MQLERNGPIQKSPRGIWMRYDFEAAGGCMQQLTSAKTDTCSCDHWETSSALPAVDSVYLTSRRMDEVVQNLQHLAAAPVQPLQHLQCVCGVCSFDVWPCLWYFNSSVVSSPAEQLDLDLALHDCLRASETWAEAVMLTLAEAL